MLLVDDDDTPWNVESQLPSRGSQSSASAPNGPSSFSSWARSSVQSSKVCFPNLGSGASRNNRSSSAKSSWPSMPPASLGCELSLPAICYPFCSGFYAVPTPLGSDISISIALRTQPADFSDNPLLVSVFDQLLAFHAQIKPVGYRADPLALGSLVAKRKTCRSYRSFQQHRLQLECDDGIDSTSRQDCCHRRKQMAANARHSQDEFRFAGLGVYVRAVDASNTRHGQATRTAESSFQLY